VEFKPDPERTVSEFTLVIDRSSMSAKWVRCFGADIEEGRRRLSEDYKVPLENIKLSSVVYQPEPSERMSWPAHQPIAPEAPIPGRHWYGGCTPDMPRVRPDGTCEECGRKACPECGHGFYGPGDTGCACNERSA
jgi:hypothetical protein